MSYIISLLLGGMLGRVAGPIAQDFFENETNMGKRIARRKEEKEIEKENRRRGNSPWITPALLTKYLSTMFRIS